MMSKESELIAKIYSEKTKEDSNTEDLANALNTISKTVFSESERYIYELIQNADDSFDEKGNNELVINIIDEYILLKYNGKAFDENDIKSITSFARRESNKKKDISKIGYKGIGFKSVFKISDYVIIKSGNYLFRFDRNYSVWNDNEKFPWQLIPVLTEIEDIPQKVLSYIDESSVILIIKVINNFDFKESILNTLGNEKIILFLNYLSKIILSENNNQLLEISVNKTNDKEVNLIKNNILTSSWFKYNEVIEINPKIKMKLQELESSECPEKLKESENIKLTLAFQIKDNRIIVNETNYIYSYLPTTLSIGLPFIVNTTFLTNAERTDLLKNEWNNYLIETIIDTNFNMLKELNKEEKYKYQILKLIAPLKLPFMRMKGFYNTYNLSLSKNIENIQFIPQQNSDELLKISECFIDLTEISNIIDINKSNNNLLLGDLKLENSIKLKEYGAKTFSFDDIGLHDFSKIQGLSEDIDLNFELINFLYQNKNILTKEKIKNFKFLLDNNNKYRDLTEIYISPTSENISENELIKFNFLNNKLYEKILNSIEILGWINDLGVKEPKDIEILRKSIYEMIRNDTISSVDSVNIIRFIFNISKQSILTENDYSIIKGIKFLTQKNLYIDSSKCLISDAYLPKLKLESIIEEDVFISKKYFNENDNSDDWIKFFKRIDVENRIDLEAWNNIPRSNLVNYVNEYLYYIDRNDFYPSNTNRYRYQHSFENILLSYMVKYLSNYNFSVYFWKFLILNWDLYKKYLQNTKYHTKISSNDVPSFITYFISTNKCLPAENNELYKKGELYSFKIKELLTLDYPVANLGENLNNEIEEFFEIKNKLNNKDCINLLLNYSKTEVVSSEILNKIEAIYYIIIENLKKELKQNSILYQLNLLSAENEFIPRENLYYFENESLRNKVINKSLFNINPSINISDARLLCDFLNVKIINNSDLEYYPFNPNKSEIIQDELLRKIDFIYVAEKHLNPDISKDKITIKLNELTFFQCTEIKIKYSNNDDIIFYWDIKSFNENNNIFFTGYFDSPFTIDLLCSNIVSLLDLSITNLELAKILLASKSDIENEYKQRGFDIIVENINEKVNKINQSEEKITEVENISENIKNIEEELNLYEKIFMPVICDNNNQINENLNFFNSNEEKDFASKLISILKSLNNKWSGYVYHMTSLDNAVNILQIQKILCRNRSVFINSAGNSFINVTDDIIKGFARFYFRPLTPTQYYNENLGTMTKHNDLPQSPGTVFFRFNIEDVLMKYPKNSFISNGNLKDYPKNTKYGNTYEFLKEIDFLNLYKTLREVNDVYTYLNASQQEFIVQSELDFSDIDYDIIVGKEQDKFTILNILENEEFNNKIIIDNTIYYNKNPFIEVIRGGDNKFEIEIRNPNNNTSGELILETKQDFSELSGYISKIVKNKSLIEIFSINNLSIQFKYLPEFKLYYINKDSKWIVYKNIK